MCLSLAVSWWLTVPLAILAGGFLVRVFIIFHDCGHGSFFKSRGANDNSRSTRTAVGFLAALRPAQRRSQGLFRQSRVGLSAPLNGRDASSVAGLSLAEDGSPVVHSSCASPAARMTFALAFSCHQNDWGTGRAQ